MSYARSDEDVVVHVLRVDPSTIWGPETAALYREAPDEVDVGWLDNGQTFSAPPAAPEPVPQSITMRQARLVLLGAGKLAQVDTAIANIQDPVTKAAAQIEWSYSNELQRDNSFVALLAPALNLTSEQVDDLFRLGSTL